MSLCPCMCMCERKKETLCERLQERLARPGCWVFPLTSRLHFCRLMDTKGQYQDRRAGQGFPMKLILSQLFLRVALVSPLIQGQRPRHQYPPIFSRKGAFENAHLTLILAVCYHGYIGRYFHFACTESCFSRTKEPVSFRGLVTWIFYQALINRDTGLLLSSDNVANGCWWLFFLNFKEDQGL